MPDPNIFLWIAASVAAAAAAAVNPVNPWDQNAFN